MSKRVKRKITYPDFDLACDLCGEHFKTPQGLAGHKRIVHAPGGPRSADQLAAGASLRELKEEVAKLKLQVEERKLRAELPIASAEPVDLMSHSGLGAFDPDVRAAVQRRALSLGDVQRPPGLVEKLLSNPEGLKLALDGLKGVLGVSHGGQGDNLVSMIKDLTGFSLKELIMGSVGPKAGSLSIAGVDLSGANLTPELLKSILDYKAAEEHAKSDFEGRKAMADSLQDLGKTFGPLLSDLLRGRGISQEKSAGISQEKSPAIDAAVETEFIVCDVCGTENIVPAGSEPGMTIHCRGEDCSMSWVIEDDSIAKSKRPAPVKRPAKVRPPERITIACPSCNQAIDVTGRPVGCTVACPVCDDEFKIASDTDALPALEPLSPDQRRDLEFHRRMRG